MGVLLEEVCVVFRDVLLNDFMNIYYIILVLVFIDDVDVGIEIE